MNPAIAKAVVLVASAVMVAIRAPHGRRSRALKAWIGFLIPILWALAPVFSFADYPLHFTPLTVGIACLAAGLWLFERAHAALGSFWSVTMRLATNA